jgi:alcohol dehydrogenase (cytochrome c)
MKLRLFLSLILLVIATTIVAQQVPFERVLNASKEPQNWLTYGGTLLNQRYSLLTQITTDNVKNLELQWVLQVRSMDGTTKFEATPLVVDGIMYTVKPPTPSYEVVALDAATGRVYWTYSYTPAEARVCCGRNNKGLAIQGDRLYLATIDTHLISLDAKTGREVFNVKVESPNTGLPADYSFTVTPLIIKDKVILGPAGGEYGIRGYVAAFDAKTGNEKWRFHVIPEPGEPGHETWGNNKSWENGGGSIWTPGSYDPELNLVYWGTGNAGPDYNGLEREGDNLYTASIVALDADTGKLRWHYQFTPHDIWDYDSTQMPVVADLTLGGELRKVVLFANRNGFFYVLDRASGKLIRGKPFIQTTWAKEIRPDGRPLLLPDSVPSEEGTKVCPDQSGGTNWMPPSFDPGLGLFFVTARESCGVFFSWKDDYNAGDGFRGGAVQRLAETNYSALRAIDVATGERRWEFPYTTQSWAGVLSTASGLVFAGGSGNLMAFDAKTGKHLWHFQTGSSLYAGAITYMVDNRQFVLMPSGTTLTAFALANF